MKPITALIVVWGAALVLLAPLTGWTQFETPNRSFHESTAFRLEGRHVAVPCASCHLNGQFAGTPTTCYACHWIRRKDDRYQTRLGAQCEQCHRPISWTAVRWDHAAATGVPLNASHRVMGCAGCHQGGSFNAAVVVCASCHQKDYAATRSPNHAAAGFPLNCDACHRPADSTWRNGSGGFDHNASFPLQGVHATVACATCHKNNLYKGTQRDCIGCHQADYNSTQNPNHLAAGFPTTCDACHRPSDVQWRGIAFNHNAVFPLQGIHATQACASCHRNNVYKGTARDCIGCHQADYNSTQNPNHLAAGFPTTCDACHRPSDVQWRGTPFNHNAVFPLQGVHATQACTACHKNNVYKGTARDCVGCHLADYTRAQSPNHVAASFPTACDSCHRPTDAQWKGASFNHNTFFALQGVHATQACTACHKNNVYKGTARDCVGCHLADYTRAQSPNHVAASFPTACDSCHRPTDAQWKGASFNHNTFFALQGVHATQACTACHKNNVYKGTARDCVGCHLAVYNATRNPNHAASGFPTTCDSCHRPTDTAWSQGRFAHTQFPLTGRHNVPCAQCHTTPNVFTQFSCTVCHGRSTDNDHRNVKGYRYDSAACYACHPNGRGGN